LLFGGALDLALDLERPLQDLLLCSEDLGRDDTDQPRAGDA
jgi:hypothetical protein